MTKHTLVPNNFYFIKPNKIVKRKISLMAKPIWLPIIFFSKPIWILFVHHLLWIKKKKMKARSEEWRCMHLKMVNVKTNNKTHSQKKKKKKKPKPKKDVPDSKQAFMWVVDTHSKEEVSINVKKFTNIFSNIFTTNIKGYY